MSDEKTAVASLPDKAQLDGSWAYKAQISALKSYNAEEDLTFKENSVKDVSDRGRQEGAARLQKALEIALSTPAKRPLKALKPGPEEDEEVDVRSEVQRHLKNLKRLRDDGPTTSRDSTVMDVLRQLKILKVSVGCLKSTKVAAELNQPFWRGGEVSPEVRQYATALVRDWRAMFREETGTAEAAMSPAVRSRKCQGRSMDLEECCYGQSQKVAHYMEVVDWVCKIILGDPEVSRSLLSGTLTSKALLAKAVEQLRIKRASQSLVPRT